MAPIGPRRHTTNCLEPLRRQMRALSSGPRAATVRDESRRPVLKEPQWLFLRLGDAARSMASLARNVAFSANVGAPALIVNMGTTSPDYSRELEADTFATPGG